MNPRVTDQYGYPVMGDQSSDWFSSLLSLETIGWIAFGLFVFLVLCFGWFVVKQQTVAVVERFGKFRRIARPGLRFRVPMIDQIVARLSMRQRELDVPVATITKDKVSVVVHTSVQYCINPDKVYDAYYRLTDLTDQFTTYVLAIILAKVPKLDLDMVFEQQEEIGLEVQNNLSATLEGFGYTIVRAMVKKVVPAEKVQVAMNDINAAEREKKAKEARGEGDRLMQVKHAEGEAETKRLQGKGTGDQMLEIARGRKAALEELRKAMPEASDSELTQFVMMTQYFDTLREIGAQAKSNTLIVPHSPGVLTDLGAQLREAVIVGDKVNQAPNGAAKH